ncbi:aconitate hydratase AcnA, partial [Candidatus Sumerlaeota bacterium]|nr:aconitate hydratase AcnA [Candidatus Sumerlaeota bacterium]
PDSLVGTDSHTTMINGLGIVGWGVGGIEAEAVMLGQPIYVLAPEVVGFKLTGRLPEGTTATDLTLTVTEILRKKGVVGKFVEFFGPGVGHLGLADRATIANMAPEYGATMGFFPVDAESLNYLRQTGRPSELVDLVERYCKAQGLFRETDSPDPIFSDLIELDLGTIQASLAGPKRPQDRVALGGLKDNFLKSLSAPTNQRGFGLDPATLNASAKGTEKGKEFELRHGSVVIAAITSCTNTSNPSVLIGAGLLAKKAGEKGLSVPGYVKTSLAPGSRVVTEYLEKTGLAEALRKLGFFTVGYGCTTCIGNSGPLREPVAKAIQDGKLVVSAVLSGNRNFEGRVHPQVQANYLASPPLVVAFAIAGRTDIDLTKEPLGNGADGEPVYLRDIWPTTQEIHAAMGSATDPATYIKLYSDVRESNPEWNKISVTSSAVYDWNADSTYIQEPPFFIGFQGEPTPAGDIIGARALGLFGDSVTTDHISPAGSIKADSPAGKYLVANGVTKEDFNSYGARRGNDRVMTRGTFANIRIKNLMVPGVEGGVTIHLPDGAQMSIYDAAMQYAKENIPLIVLAGKEYGTGSSRDWAAKGTKLLGVRAVIAESFERIHRSNLVGMGVLPLQFKEGQNAQSLGLSGREVFRIAGISEGLTPFKNLPVVAESADRKIEFEAVLRIDSPIEIEYYKHGGILDYVLREYMKS